MSGFTFQEMISISSKHIEGNNTRDQEKSLFCKYKKATRLITTKATSQVGTVEHSHLRKEKRNASLPHA